MVVSPARCCPASWSGRSRAGRTSRNRLRRWWRELSIAEHGPYRVDGDEHPFRPILKAPETEAAVEFHATREDLVSAVADHIQNDQLQPHLAGDIPGATKRVDRKVRPETLALPAPIHGNHREVQRRDTAGVRRSSGSVRSEVARGDCMGVQRIVTKHLGRFRRHGDEYPREVVLLLLPRAEPQKVVEAVRSTGKPRPVMPAGIERLNDDSGDGFAVPVTLRWRSGSGSCEPRPEPPVSAAAGCRAPPAESAGPAPKVPWSDARAESARPPGLRTP